MIWYLTDRKMNSAIRALNMKHFGVEGKELIFTKEQELYISPEQRACNIVHILYNKFKDRKKEGGLGSSLKFGIRCEQGRITAEGVSYHYILIELKGKYDNPRTGKEDVITIKEVLYAEYGKYNRIDISSADDKFLEDYLKEAKVVEMPKDIRKGFSKALNDSNIFYAVKLYSYIEPIVEIFNGRARMEDI